MLLASRPQELREFYAEKLVASTNILPDIEGLLKHSHASAFCCPYCCSTKHPRERELLYTGRFIFDYL
jgi:hypothetical protein